ncbi:MAG: pentapeptide repeat-containing protein [Cyanobacteria bacterium J06623_4]
MKVRALRDWSIGLAQSSISILLVAAVLVAVTIFGSAPPTLAGPTGSAHPALTLSALDRQMAAAAQQRNVKIISLKGFTINLRENSAEETAFVEQFYQRLQKGLNPKGASGSQIPGLDLSDAVVLGDFDLTRLSLRVPAYSTTAPASPSYSSYRNDSTPTVRTRPRSSRKNFGSSTGALSRFLLLPAQTPQLDTYIFQGPLLLTHTCFNGGVTAKDLSFLNRVEASRAIFTQAANWQGSQFTSSLNFSQAQFQQESRFRAALFSGRSRFKQAQFNGLSSWQASTFQQGASFAQANFRNATFARAHWQANADFDRATFQEVGNFQKSRFDQSLFLTDAQLEGALNFRQAQFQGPISLRGAHVLSQIDFGDARFANALINVADLDFSAGDAQFLGTPGQIGQRFSVPTLTSNETVLRTLVRNFRLLEQIADANQLEYTTEQLRLARIRRYLFGLSINQATTGQLIQAGFSEPQARAIAQRAQQDPFVSRSDLLALDEVDLATYLQVRDRIIVSPTHPFDRLQQLIHWLALASLLLLSHYGTNVGLVFSVGLLATTAFAIMYWLVDRYRRRQPTPIVPTRDETVAVLLGSAALLTLSFGLLSQSSEHMGRTLAAVGLLVLPVPAALIGTLYQQGRYHDLMDRSYLVENGALRRLQVLIARLPTPPKFPFYRDRYTPLLSDRRWNWLNYFDFSFNNWFKFGFNDIRLRDRAVPGLISALVWYQWSLGVAYITLLLWTLSRTIPGLNLLLYF